MKWTQVSELVNDVTKEMIGEEATLLTDDLSNVVDVGNEVLAESYDAFTKKLLDRVTRTIFVDRKYTGAMAKLRRDSWEFGIKQKIYMTEIPEAVDDDSYKLVHGSSYDDNKFNQPALASKFYQQAASFRVDISVTEKQVRTAFSNRNELNSFVSMLFNAVDTSIELKLEGLAKAAVSYLIGSTVLSDIPDLDQAKTGVKAVNLLKLYNDQFSATLAKKDALYTPDFIRFSVLVISQYLDKIATASTLFNGGKLLRYTPRNKQMLIMSSFLKSAANVYLQSDTFHEQYTALPMSESIANFQGTGSSFDFDTASSIHIEIKDPENPGSTKEISWGGILAVLFDYDACGVDCEEREVTSHVNAGARFTNYFYHQEARYWVDTNENAVVFFIGEATI